MKKSNKKSLTQLKAALIAALALCLVGVAVIYVYKGLDSHLYSGGEYPIQLRISPSKEQYKKSEYVVIDVSIENVGDFGITLLGACSGYYDAIVDWQFPVLRDEGANRGCNSMALPTLSPGQKSNLGTLELDLSRFDAGQHTLTVVYDYEDPVSVQQARSNEVAVDILSGDNITDEGCYSFTEYPVSYCEQVMIRATHNLTTKENNKTCHKIYDKYIDRYAPRPNPISNLSTLGCDEGKPAVFVFNVPKGQSRIFEDSVARAKKSDKVCWSTRYSRDWIDDPSFNKLGCSL